MDMKVVDVRKVKKRQLILVVENVDETRAGIDTLLKADGYRFRPFESEITSQSAQPPS